MQSTSASILSSDFEMSYSSIALVAFDKSAARTIYDFFALMLEIILDFENFPGSISSETTVEFSGSTGTKSSSICRARCIPRL